MAGLIQNRQSILIFILTVSQLDRPITGQFAPRNIYPTAFVICYPIVILYYNYFR